jgi:hypothetical protein
MMRLRSDGRMTKGSEDHPKKGRDAEDGYNARAAFPQQGGYNFFCDFTRQTYAPTIYILTYPELNFDDKIIRL